MKLLYYTRVPMHENLYAPKLADSVHFAFIEDGKALPLLHIDALWQNTIKGVMILAVVVINVILQRIADRNALARREM